MAEPLARHSLEALTQLMLRQTELRAALALQQPPSQDGTMRLCLWYSPRPSGRAARTLAEPKHQRLNPGRSRRLRHELDIRAH